MKKILMASVFVLLMIGAVANAQSYEELESVVASDGAANDFFGVSLDVSLDKAIVGAFHDDDNGGDSGSAYIYSWNGSSWDGEYKLAASDGGGQDEFGISVSIDGDTAVVGAPYNDENGSDAGAAYIFKWNGSAWVETKIVPSDIAAGDHFGISVAVDGDNVVVGARADDSYTGSVYLFEWNGSSWDETKIQASDKSTSDDFGTNVKIEGTRIVVGAPRAGVGGALYIYDWNGGSWDETKLVSSDVASNDNFAGRVDLSGDRVIAAAYHDNSYTGAAYVYNWTGSTWNETKLTASDGAANNYFGLGLAIEDDVIIVGAPYNTNTNGASAGAAYMYTWNGSSWDETKKIASDGSASDYFGSSMAIFGEAALVGAYGNNGNSGSVYFLGAPVIPGTCTTYATTFFDTFNFYGSSSALTALGTYVYQYFYYDCESKSFQYGNESSALTTAPDTSSKQGTTTEIATINTNKTAEEGKNYYDSELGTFKTGASDGSLVTLTAPTGKILDATGIAAVSDADEGDFYFNTTTGEFHIAQANGSLAVLFTTN